MCSASCHRGGSDERKALVPESRGAGTGVSILTLISPGKPRQDGTAGAFLCPEVGSGAAPGLSYVRKSAPERRLNAARTWLRSGA
jgi:hypothetical protein